MRFDTGHHLNMADWRCPVFRYFGAAEAEFTATRDIRGGANGVDDHGQMLSDIKS